MVSTTNWIIIGVVVVAVLWGIYELLKKSDDINDANIKEKEEKEEDKEKE